LSSAKIKIRKIVVFRVMLHVCKTWSLSLGEKRNLKLPESKVPKNEVIEGCRIVYNVQLYNIVYSVQLYNSV
jgi:hypothetical protein